MANHTRGPLIVHVQGDADDYCLLTTDRRWVMAFRQNGELLNEEQKANIDLIAETFTVATETGMAPRQMQAMVAELSRTLEAEREKARQLDTQYAQTVPALEHTEARFKIGQKYKTRHEHPRFCTVTEILKTYNSKGELVKIRYVAEHVFMGQKIEENDVVDTTISMGAYD